MSKIDVSQWKEFKISDLFSVRPSKYIKKNGRAMSNIELLDDGDYPVIVNSSEHNGIGGYTSQVVTEPGNVITYSDTVNGNTVFYQAKSFVGYSHVKVMEPKVNLDSASMIFLTTVIRKCLMDGGYDFVNKMTTNRVLNTIIKLPVTSSGEPDWQYMDSYIAKRAALAHKYVSELKSTNNQRKSLKISGWQEYKLSDLFEPEFTDGDNKVKDLEQSDDGVNLVGPLNSNNGVLGKFISDTKVFPAGTLTWDMFGKCYEQFEPYQTVSHGHVLVLNPKVKLDKFSLLFVASVLTRLGQNSHFGYNNMLTISKFNNLTIMLPALSDGTPDWATMRKRVADFQCSVYRTMILLLDLV